MKKLSAMILIFLLILTLGTACALSNPWRDATRAEIVSAIGGEFVLPEGARDLEYELQPETGLVEIEFELPGESVDYTLRIHKANAFTDISGLYYSWADEFTYTTCGVDFITKRAFDDDDTIDLCLWYDDAAQRMYSLEAEDEDLEGFDILAAALAIAQIDEVKIAASADAISEVTDEAANGMEDLPLCGGWTVCDIHAPIDEAALAAFNKAMEHFAGVGYEPVGLLSTQIVAGMNYCFLCKATPVTPNPVTYWAYVTVYADLQGGAEITSIGRIE